MFLEYLDMKRADWSPGALATVLGRLQESGYQGLTVEIHGVLGRFVQPHGDRALAASLAVADWFTEILIPPAQPHTRVILHRPAPEIARVVVIGRSQQEVHTATTAVKMHLEQALGAKLNDLIADENGRAILSRFRREVLPALRLTGDSGPRTTLRHPQAAPLLKALQQQPPFRGRPTVLSSHVTLLAPDRPAAQTLEALELLAVDGVIERWHVVTCRQNGQWLAVSQQTNEIKAFAASNVACPHCGRRVNDEQGETAFRMGDEVQAYLGDNRWICDLVETALRRLGVEAVAVHPGLAAVDGAACYHSAVLIFRAREGGLTTDDARTLKDEAHRLEEQGWRVFPILISNQPVADEVEGAGVTVIEGTGTMESSLAEVLSGARSANLSTLLPPVWHAASVSLADLLPAEQPQPDSS